MDATIVDAAPPQADDLLTSAAVRASLGDISDMTLWRWTQSRGFPQPNLTIGNRKFWRRRTVQNWIATQEAARAAKAA